MKSTDPRVWQRQNSQHITQLIFGL